MKGLAIACNPMASKVYGRTRANGIKLVQATTDEVSTMSIGFVV